MKSLTLLGAALLTSGFVSAQTAHERYDRTASVFINGLYGTLDDVDLPGKLDVSGALLGANYNIAPANSKVFHSFSFTTGYLSSNSSDPLYVEGYLSGYYATGTYSLKIDEIMPFMAGYTLNFPIAESAVYGFLGVKAGVWSYTVKETLTGTYDSHSINEELSTNETDFTYGATIGLRIPVGESTDVIVSYELFKIKDVDTINTFQVGLSFTF